MTYRKGFRKKWSSVEKSIQRSLETREAFLVERLEIYENSVDDDDDEALCELCVVQGLCAG